MINRASLTELSRGLLCNIIMLFMVLWKMPRARAHQFFSSGLGFGLETQKPGLGLKLETCWTRTRVLRIWTRTRDMRTRTRGNVASLINSNWLFPSGTFLLDTDWDNAHTMFSGPLRYPTRFLFGPTPVYFVHSWHSGSLPTSWSCNPSVCGWHSVLRACLPTGVVTGSSINDDCARSIGQLDEGELTEAESRQDAVYVDQQGTNARQNWSGWDSRTVSWCGVPDIRPRLGGGIGWELRHGWTDW